MNILVTDGENRAALAVTRSLGRYGHYVFVSSPNLINISSKSKYCKKALSVPDPMSDMSSYIGAILSIAERENIEVIVPTTEQSIFCLNQAREQFPHNVILACPSPEKMELVSNKYKLFELAEKLGVPIPQTTYVSDFDDFMEKRNRVTNFPAVVKPSLSKFVSDGKIISAGVMYAKNERDLVLLYESKHELRYPSLIQELIVGEGTGLFTLFDHDRHLALFSHRRILEKPPSGGVSVFSESVPLDCNMVESARKLLTFADWQGIAMVEFKRDSRDGSAKLMEINGRFWGSLQLAVSSKMDFPALLFDYYCDKKPSSLLSNYTVGHKLKWPLGVLDHLIIRLKNQKRQVFIPECPTLWDVVSLLFMFRDQNMSHDVFDPDDIKPFIWEIKDYIGNIIR